MNCGKKAGALALLALLGVESLAGEQGDEPLEGLVQRAIADLTARLSTGSTAVAVVEVRALVWPDASLGCPRPDMKYKQVPVDGYRILLRVDGQNYSYHGDGRRGPFYCARPVIPEGNSPRPPGRDPDA